MRIFITSGGTEIDIDRVRRIRNMSSGTFGEKIALEAMKLGHKVLFLRHRDSKGPFIGTFDLYQEQVADAERRFKNLMRRYEVYRDLYSEQTYRTFDEYAQHLNELLDWERPDITILAAAVSDYGVANYHPGKLRSGDAMNIQLSPLPKLIGKVQEWCPTTTLTGFKLLVDSHQKDLIAAAQKSIDNNHCDMVVANDLEDIQKGQHRLLLVKPDGTDHVSVKRLETDPEDPNYLARMVVIESVEARRK